MKYCIITNKTRIGDFDTEAEMLKVKETIHESWKPIVVELTDILPEELTRQAPMAFQVIVTRKRWWHKPFEFVTRKKLHGTWVTSWERV